MSQVRLENSLLSVKNLKLRYAKEYGTFVRRRVFIDAVNDVTFDVAEGETAAIVGESGSGKTSVAKCIMKLAQPTSGSIVYDGTNISTIRGRSLLSFRRDIQIIYQDPYESLNPRWTVFTAIATPIRYLLHVKDNSRVDEMVQDIMKETGLDPSKFAQRLPHQLSGGERQRVNIARALASNPRILIADEPTTMLDAAQRANILNLIAQLQSRRKLAIILITHDLATAKMVSSRLLVMYLGKLIESGRTQDLLSRPHHPYVELLLHSVPQVKPTGAFEPTIDSTSTDENNAEVEGCKFRPRCKYATSACEREPELLEKSPSHEAACHNPLNT